MGESMRERVLAKFGSRCAYCGCVLSLKTLQVDHFEPLRRGDAGDKAHLEVFENYYPACRSCNYYKNTLDIEGFRVRMDLMITNLRRQSTVKALVRFDKILFVGEPVTFYFETLGDSDG